MEDKTTWWLNRKPNYRIEVYTAIASLFLSFVMIGGGIWWNSYKITHQFGLLGMSYMNTGIKIISVHVRQLAEKNNLARKKGVVSHPMGLYRNTVFFTVLLSSVSILMILLCNFNIITGLIQCHSIERPWEEGELTTNTTNGKNLSNTIDILLIYNKYSKEQQQQQQQKQLGVDKQVVIQLGYNLTERKITYTEKEYDRNFVIREKIDYIEDTLDNSSNQVCSNTTVCTGGDSKTNIFAFIEKEISTYVVNKIAETENKYNVFKFFNEHQTNEYEDGIYMGMYTRYICRNEKVMAYFFLFLINSFLIVEFVTLGNSLSILIKD